MSTSVKQYVGQRADLLAHLVLTRRQDVRVHPLQQQDTGLDLFVEMLNPVWHGQVVPSFGVEVTGTEEPLPDEHAATQYVNHKGKHWASKGVFLFPMVVLLFSMERDQGYFGWHLEPQVTKAGGPVLNRVSPLEMTKITKKTMDDIVQRVEKWFEAMAVSLIRPVPTK